MNLWKSAFAALGIGVLTCLASPGQASVTIEDGLGSLPSSLDFETYDFSTSDQNVGEKNNRDLTQSFTLDTAIDVDKFLLSVNGANEGSTVNLRLFNVPGDTVASVLVLGTEILSEAYTFTAADAIATGGGGNAGDNTDNLLTWDVSSLNLAAGKYALQIDGPDNGTTHIRWRRKGENPNSNPYADGRFYRDNGNDGDLDQFGNTDLDAALGIVAIPEPASLILLGLGSICLVGRSRSRF